MSLKILGDKKRKRHEIEKILSLKIDFDFGKSSNFLGSFVNNWTILKTILSLLVLGLLLELVVL